MEVPTGQLDWTGRAFINVISGGIKTCWGNDLWGDFLFWLLFLVLLLSYYFGGGGLPRVKAYCSSFI